MNDLEFTFRQMPAAFDRLQPGDTVSALAVLTEMESADETELQELLEILSDRQIGLDITALPKVKTAGDTAARLALEEQLVQKGNLPGGLSDNDPLRLYLEEIAGLPIAGDPQIMAEELAAGNEEIAHRLAENMFGTVVETAKEYAGKGVLLLDLIQEGSLGLWQAIQSYHTGDFAAHCNWWVRQYMAGAVLVQAKAAGVGEKMARAAQDYRSVDEKLLTELGRNPTLTEMAEGLHMTLEETAAVAEMLENARNIQRAKAPKAESLPEEENQAVEDTAYFQMRQRIAELLSDLPEQDVKLLTLRYGLEGGLPMDPKQVGTQLGITEEEVVTREAAALSKLRQHN